MAVVIRRAKPEDAAAIARVHVESWRSTYAGLLPERLLLKLSNAQHESRWWRHVLGRFRRSHFVYVAEDPRDGVVGFISGGAARDELGDLGTEIEDQNGVGHRALVGIRAPRHRVGSGRPMATSWVTSTQP